MSEIHASVNLDWAWIEFVGLWLVSPTAVIIGATMLLDHWRGRRHP